MCIHNYLPVHLDLLVRLEGLRGAEKTVQEVGPTMMDWVSLMFDSLPTCKDNNNLLT